MISKSSKIYVAGHKGMVGSATVRKLQKEGFNNLIFKTSKELDLRNQSLVDKFTAKEKPDLIIDAAAIVGGIWANNKYPFKFLMDNMQIQNNLINAAVKNKVKNFIFLGSSCIYPRDAKQPLKEEYLLTSSLESTNQWYALAKITGVKLIEAARKVYGYNYVSLIACYIIMTLIKNRLNCQRSPSWPRATFAGRSLLHVAVVMYAYTRTRPCEASQSLIRSYKDLQGPTRP